VQPDGVARSGRARGLSEVVEWVEDNWQQTRRQPLEYQHRR